MYARSPFLELRHKLAIAEQAPENWLSGIKKGGPKAAFDFDKYYRF
jgi:hypothetical protein